MLDVRGVRVPLRIAPNPRVAPGIADATLNEAALGGVIRRECVMVVMDVHEPASLKLLQIAEAGN